MPACFSLTRKGESGPTKLVAIDEELCHHFGAEVHKTKWFSSWYDIVGFKLACGQDWREVRADLSVLFAKYVRERHEYGIAFQRLLIEITNYLEQHFTQDSWVEIG